MEEEKPSQNYEPPKAAEDLSQKDVDWIIKRAIALQQEELTARTRQTPSFQALSKEDSLKIDSTPQPYNILRHAMTETINSGEIPQSYWDKSIEERLRNNASAVSNLEVLSEMSAEAFSAGKATVRSLYALSKAIFLVPTILREDDEKNPPSNEFSPLAKFSSSVGLLGGGVYDVINFGYYFFGEHSHPNHLYLATAHVLTNALSGIYEWGRYKKKSIQVRKLEKLNGKKD